MLLSALVFMPFFGVNFSSAAASISPIVTNTVKQTTVTIVNSLGNPQIVNESARLCDKGVLFNLNQSANCFSKVVLNLQTASPIYSVVVAPITKLITTVSVISLWFTNQVVMHGFEGLPIILASLLSVLFLFLLFTRRNLFAYSFAIKSFYPNNPSLSLLQVYRC